jgi:membrane protein YqaA with SNARE-associated domain
MLICAFLGGRVRILLRHCASISKGFAGVFHYCFDYFYKHILVEHKLFNEQIHEHENRS